MVRGTIDRRGWAWLAALIAVGPVPAVVAAQGPSLVWVNPRSGVYHCPGASTYGRTTRGEYLSEAEARQRGFRPAGGRPCDPTVVLPGAVTPGPDAPPPPPADSLLPCAVTRIVDGDGIECAGMGHVRLIGADAPETSQEPFGTAATAGLASLVPLGAAGRLELGAEHRDRLGRLLGYFWLEGTLVNWTLVRHGWAVSLRIPPNVRYADAFAAAERRAASERRGLWRVGGFDCRPADHRARRC